MTAIDDVPGGKFIHADEIAAGDIILDLANERRQVNSVFILDDKVNLDMANGYIITNRNHLFFIERTQHAD